jgi:hypothetical protein
MYRFGFVSFFKQRTAMPERGRASRRWIVLLLPTPAASQALGTMKTGSRRDGVDPPGPSSSVATPTLLHRATQLRPALLHRAGHPPSPTALSLQCSRSSSRPPSPRPSTLQQMRSPRAPRRRPAIPPAHGIQGQAGGRRQGRTQRAPCREKARFPQLFFPSLSLQGDAWLEEGQLVLVCRLSASKVSFSGELLNSAVVTAPIVP